MVRDAALLVVAAWALSMPCVDIVSPVPRPCFAVQATFQTVSSRRQEAMSRVVGAMAHAGATRSLSDAEQQLFSAACKTATKVGRTSVL